MINVEAHAIHCRMANIKRYTSISCIFLSSVTVNDDVYLTPLRRFSKPGCSTTTRVPVLIPNDTSPERSRRDMLPRPTVLARTRFHLSRYRAWKIGPGGCYIRRPSHSVRIKSNIVLHTAGRPGGLLEQQY